MAINIQKLLIPVVLGGVDVGMEIWDEKSLPTPRTAPFKTARDLHRLALVGAGLAAQLWFPRWAAMGELITTAELPLLTKSVANAIRRATAAVGTIPGSVARYPAMGGVPQAFVPRRAVSDWAGQQARGGYRPLT